MRLENLLTLVVDEADLIYTYAYDGAMEQLKAYLPGSHQAILCSATLSEEVLIVI